MNSSKRTLARMGDVQNNFSIPLVHNACIVGALWSAAWSIISCSRSLHSRTIFSPRKTSNLIQLFHIKIHNFFIIFSLFSFTQHTRLSSQTCRVLYVTVYIGNSCIECVYANLHTSNPRTRCAPFRMLLIMELRLKIHNCLDQNEELRVQAYLQLADFDFIGSNIHNDRTKVEGKTCFLWLKISNGEFCFDFQLLIEIIFF